MSAFFAWLGQLPALAQVPIIVLAFVVLVGYYGRIVTERMNGRDLLVQMAGQLDTQILHLRLRRNRLRSNEASS